MSSQNYKIHVKRRGYLFSLVSHHLWLGRKFCSPFSEVWILLGQP